MKSLVTGGAGFIGSHLVDKPLTLGYEVIVNKSFYWKDLVANYQYDSRDYERIGPLFEGVNSEEIHVFD